jgi:hypothetical protein
MLRVTFGPSPLIADGCQAIDGVCLLLAKQTSKFYGMSAALSGHSPIECYGICAHRIFVVIEHATDKVCVISLSANLPVSLANNPSRYDDTFRPQIL